MILGHPPRITCLALLAWSCFAGRLATGWTQEVSESKIRRALETAIAMPLGSLPSEIQKDRQRIDKWLLVEPRRAQWSNARLRWSPRRRMKMTIDQRFETLAALDRFLRYALENARDGNGEPLFKPAEANDVADRSELSIAAQPHPWELTDEQLHGAFQRAIRVPKLAALVDQVGDHFQVPSLEERSLALSMNGGILTWQLRPHERTRGRDQEQTDSLNDRNSERLKRHADALVRFLRSALGDIDDPRLGVPLLDPGDASSVPIRIGAERITFTAPRGAAGVALLRSSSTRAGIQRTIKGIQWSSFPRQETWRPEPDLAAMGAATDADPQQLVIDTGAFAGAAVNKLAFNPDGKLLGAAGDVVRIWDIASGELLHTLRGQGGGCTDLAFTPDGRQLLVSADGFDQSLRVYDVAAMQEIREVHVGHEGHIERLAISPDGEWLITYGVDRRLQVWNWPSREIVATHATDDPIDHLSFPSSSPEVLLITSTGRYGWLRIADGELVKLEDRGALEAWLNDTATWPGEGAPHPYSIDVGWSRERLLAGGHGKRSGDMHYWCGIWNRSDSAPLTVHEHGYNVTACALSPDSETAASADALGNVHVWSTADGTLRREFPTRTRPIYSVLFDGNDEQIHFGRRRFLDGQWSYNRYGPLSETFSLPSRRVEEREDGEPPSAILNHGDYALKRTRSNKDNDLQLELWERGRQQASLQFAGALKMQPLWYSMLRGRAMGFDNAVILGTEGGSLVCLDPDTLISRRSFLGHTDRVWCVTQATNDDRLLVSASADGTIRFWRLEPPRRWGNLAVLADQDGRVQMVFPNTPTANAGIVRGDVIRGIDFRPLSQLRQTLAAGGNWPFNPGESKFVELQRGREIVEKPVKLSWTGDIARPLLSCFITADSKDWVTWTPEGYYDASPGGQRLIGWHVNQGIGRAARFLPIEDYRERYHRPELIDQLLSTLDLKLALDELQAAPDAPPQRFQPTTAIVAEPPQVIITSPASDLITGSSEIEVVAEITSPQRHSVRDVSVLVNGRPIHVKEFDRNQHGMAIVRHHLSLNVGRNEISVTASNGVARARSKPVWVNYRESVAEPAARRLFVVAVGISDYQDDRFDLTYADADARAFAEACEKQAGPFYESVETRVVVNDEATKREVEKALDWLVKNTQQNDVAILFLAGHGLMDDRKNYYFATHEMNPTELRSSCLRWSAVHEVARDLRGTFLLFADTCHAGAVAGRAIIGNPLHELARDDLGTVVFAACGRHEVSIEQAGWQHGAFTRSLLDILGSLQSDLDDPPDGKLSITELEYRLDRKVGELTKGRQRPVSQKPRTVRDFDLFVLPAPAAQNGM